MLFRYLEDVIHLINYRPPLVKSTKREKEDESRAFREEYKSKGLDDQSVSVIQNLSRAERIDYQVCMFRFGDLCFLSLTEYGI